MLNILTTGLKGRRGVFIRPLFIILFLFLCLIIYFVFYELNFGQPTNEEKIASLSGPQQFFIKTLRGKEYEEYLNKYVFEINLNKRLIGYGIPVLIFGLLAFVIFYYARTRQIYCGNCNKTVVPSNIKSFICPNCNTSKSQSFDLMFFCRNCKDIVYKIPCPFCDNYINMIEPYNPKQILKKRYEG